MPYYVAFGRGHFPDDMLRYDNARQVTTPLPYDQLGEEIKALVPSNPKWSYHLLHSKHPPTIARWNSFLWGCIVLPK